MRVAGTRHEIEVMVTPRDAIAVPTVRRLLKPLWYSCVKGSAFMLVAVAAVMARATQGEMLWVSDKLQK